MHQVAVIGCGVIGLTSALAIQNRLGSAKVTIFAKQKSPNTTGDVAAGLWCPYLLQNTAEDLVKKWAKTTQDYILKLWKSGKAKKAGISLQTITSVTDEDDYQSPKWLKTTLGYQELTQEQLDSYGRKIGLKLKGGFTYVGFIWEASRFLPFLEQEFLRNGGEIILKTVENFEELPDFDVIVNCTGLGAKNLVPDSKMEPIRGQILRVEAPWQFHTLLVNSIESLYIIPNINCVILGGTKQRNDYNLDVSQQDKQKILNGCKKLIPSLAGSKFIRDEVGLRPGRDEINLDFHIRKCGRKNLKIVNNYGHGGSGITLSIGCAESCALIVEDALLASKL